MNACWGVSGGAVRQTEQLGGDTVQASSIPHACYPHTYMLFMLTFQDVDRQSF